MDLRSMFNERKWNSHTLDLLGLLIRHRGAPGDVRTVLGAEIVDVRKNGLIVEADPLVYGEGEDVEPVAEDGRVFIPYHRILKVTDPRGTVWIKPGWTEAEPVPEATDTDGTG